MAIQPKINENDVLLTQKEIAETLGISRIAVQQIELRAFRKIKEELNKRRISAKDLF